MENSIWKWLRTCRKTGYMITRTTIIIIIIIIIIEFLTSQLWLGNIHLSWDVVNNQIRLVGLICSLKSFLQLNMCQELQIFADVYMYWGAG
jgi:hypothetical protein